MNPIFSYSPVKSPIHRIPAWLKLLVLLLVPITVYLCPICVSIALIALFPVIAAVGRIRLPDFLHDLKPISYYCLMILAIDVLSYLLFKAEKLISQRSLVMILRLLCAMEATSVFFRTTSTFEIRDTLQGIESAVTFGHSKLVFSSMFTLFLTFLPQIFANWSALDLAYRARGGRRGPAKAVVLLPRLVTMSLKGRTKMKSYTLRTTHGAGKKGCR